RICSPIRTSVITCRFMSTSAATTGPVSAPATRRDGPASSPSSSSRAENDHEGDARGLLGLPALFPARVAPDQRARRIRHGNGGGREYPPLPRPPRRLLASSGRAARPALQAGGGRGTRHP